MDPLDAVRLAWNTSSPLRSCHTSDAATIRVWGDSVDACATRRWRTSEWTVADGGGCECVIPHRLSLTGQRDFRAEDTLLGKNLRETLARMRVRDVAFRDDAACLSLLREMEASEEAFRGVALATSFAAHAQDGRIRSDICRLGMLWERGGYYLDNDLVLLDDVASRLAPGTTFASVTTVRWMFHNPPGLFNAFVACAPRHPIVREALLRHARWWRARDPEEERRITRGNAHRPNLGTVFLRDALRSVVGDAAAFECERDGVCNGGVQLFREVALDRDGEYNASGLCTMCDATHECNFAVADVPSGDVLMKSRVATRSGRPCPVRCAADAACRSTDERAPPPTPRPRSDARSQTERPGSAASRPRWRGTNR